MAQKSLADSVALVTGATSGIGLATAGIEGDPLAPLHESSLENFDRVFRTNVRSVYSCLQHEARAMLADGGYTAQ